jgi:hypothetical protein
MIDRSSTQVNADTPGATLKGLEKIAQGYGGQRGVTLGKRPQKIFPTLKGLHTNPQTAPK